MPTTRKQKKARKSRGLEILSDIKNLELLLGERHYSAREESVNSNSVRRPESAKSNMFGNNDGDTYLNHREMGFGDNIDPGHNSASANSNVEINRLSSELNSRLSREMDQLMTSVNVHIQRAISDAISNQILPQIQNALGPGSRRSTQNRWNVPFEIPKINSEDIRYEKIRENSRSEPIRERPDAEYTGQAYDILPSIFYPKSPIFALCLALKTFFQ